MSNDLIYFDHSATTPMHPEAIAAYAEAASQGPSNPSSLHAAGRAARGRIIAARDKLAAILRCDPAELVFTGGGTESDNAALYGAARAQRARDPKRTRIVTTAVEHHAVLHACEKLEEDGFELYVLPVDNAGRVSVDDADKAIGETTAVVSVMAANNEVGTLQPVGAIGRIARERGAVMHVDAVQAFGYETLDLREMPVDLLSLSAHKVNGPQGVGALFIRKGAPFEATQRGGSQERGRRAGTENVAGIAAFVRAAELAAEEREERRAHVRAMREALLDGLAEQLGADAFAVNGAEEESMRVPHILNVSFLGLSNETMLMNLDLAGVAASAGSACTAGSLQPSHVLTAMGLAEERCRSAIRFSFGLGNNIAEAEKTAKIIATIAKRLRNR
ncbi:cysteine desulfurase family protein [Cohnella lubricantis]|uniref:cysteine desulfurase n=1 Tax=Cohnella lubricantis TaxID=2163172 RepID=A0A841T7D2_9BACL|nr:cysteine desulfurase family protein [Cohnella lubricantis]MBB6675855.1 cysteine desulfurase [Cohnella lubricantis]MBP2119731.1 cysteine desulfurase [Cohnella lubricantis]